jgi:hypothetical protein
MTQTMYKGRTITANETNGYGSRHTHLVVNGVYVWTFPGRSEADVVALAQGLIDKADAETWPHRRPRHWYAS